MKPARRQAFIGCNQTAGPAKRAHDLPFILQINISIQTYGIHSNRITPLQACLHLISIEDVQSCHTPTLRTRRSIVSRTGRRAQLGKTTIIS